jgi:hypothetical protein
MTKFARTLGAIIALVMGLASAYVYLNTGDWVAVIFFLGSLGYLLFFMIQREEKT